MSSSGYKDPRGWDHYRVSWPQEDSMLGPLEGEKNPKQVNLEGRNWSRVDKPCWFLTQILPAEAEEDRYHPGKGQRLGGYLWAGLLLRGTQDPSAHTQRSTFTSTTTLPPRSSPHSSLSHAPPWLSHILFPGPGTASFLVWSGLRSCSDSQ